MTTGKMHKKRPIPYGEWPSALDAAQVAAASPRRDLPLVHGGELYYLEGRPAEGGRVVVVRQSGAGRAEDCLPPPFSARSKVHEYGGGALFEAGKALFFVNGADQDIYELERDGGAPRRITDRPELRFADGCGDARHERLITVAERHDGGDEPQNLLVAISLDPDSAGEVTELVTGADFYAYPRLSPDGRVLVWVQWNKPFMPWEASELWLGEVGADGRVGAARRLAGGRGSAATEPRWDGRDRLYFVDDRSGWGGIYRYEDGVTDALDWPEHEFGQLLWGLAASSYGLLDDGRIAAACRHGGRAGLALHQAGPGWRWLETPLRQIDALCIRQTHIVVLATTDTKGPHLAMVDPDSPEPRPLTPRPPVMESADISVAEPLEFATTGGGRAYGLFYPPRNQGCEGLPGTRPPLIVLAHGGPTGHADRGLKLKIQYWTTRGFAVLDVDYRGSHGYGRAYRERLNGRWGVTDVEDVIAGARFAVAKGLADERRLLGSGSSAGGYTVLMALCRSGIFAAGTSLYGISDLERLAALTHKFEAGSLTTLLGAEPGSDVFRRRSPCHLAGDIRASVLFLQGLDDVVVPPAQSRAMADLLARRGLPVALIEFAGEGHGFRRAENIVTALESEYGFYARILGLSPAEALRNIPLHNMPEDP
ncbi:MAG TPA: S9 family peptidase [Rhodobacteraceae bacterium]|nr:S9 family peptidase [Paracoccaceae bacterium]